MARLRCQGAAELAFHAVHRSLRMPRAPRRRRRVQPSQARDAKLNGNAGRRIASAGLAGRGGKRGAGCVIRCTYRRAGLGGRSANTGLSALKWGLKVPGLLWWALVLGTPGIIVSLFLFIFILTIIDLVTFALLLLLSHLLHTGDNATKGSSRHAITEPLGELR